MKSAIGILAFGSGFFAMGMVTAAEPAHYYPEPAAHTVDTFRSALHDAIENAVEIPYSSTAFDTHDAVDILDEVAGNSALVELIYSDAVAAKVDWPGYNREHVWPQSLGAMDGSPAHSDMHHIFACDANVNSARGNKPYGNCEGECTSHPEAPEARYNSAVFEPPADQKGDIARALFYMDLRYEGENGEPDLVLINGDVTPGCDCMGQLDMLLEWHNLDPVDAREEARNEAVYGLQGNRNPFVDHPEWVGALYGDALWVAEAPGAPVAAPVENNEPTFSTLFVRPNADEDGDVAERIAYSGKGGKVANRGQHIRVGDTLTNTESAGVLSFSLNFLPADAVVTGARIHLTQTLTPGTPGIYERMGEIEVELARRFLGSSSALQKNDFEDETAMIPAGTLETEAAAGEMVVVELSDNALNYLRSGGKAQFRARFAGGTNGDDTRDQVGFASGDHPNFLMQPVLEIEYYQP